MDSGNLESEDSLHNNNNKEGNTYIYNISNKDSSVQIGDKNTMALSTREANFEKQLLRLTSSMLVQLSEMKRSISHLEVNFCGIKHSKKPKKDESDDCHTHDIDREDWIGDRQIEEEGWADAEGEDDEDGYSDKGEDEVWADAEGEGGEDGYSDDEVVGEADAEEESGEDVYSDEEDVKADAEEGQEHDDSGDDH